MPSPHCGGVSVHGILDEGAAGTLVDAGGRDVADGREEAGPAAPEFVLQRFPQVLRNAVQFNLGVSVVHDAYGFAIGPRLFHLAENPIEVAVVVAGQVDAVRVLVEKATVELQGVVLHLEAVRHAREH